MRILSLCLLACVLFARQALAQSVPPYEVQVQPTQVQAPASSGAQQVTEPPVDDPSDAYGADPYGTSAAQGSEVSEPYGGHPQDPDGTEVSADPYGDPRGSGPDATRAADASPVLLPEDPALTAEEDPSLALQARVTNATHVDGHPRMGNFLAGPGSMDFILHHTLMGAAGGLAITGIPGRFDVGDVGPRTTMLLGTLGGAALGFATSAWFQFNNWIDYPAAHYGIIHSLVGAMVLAGITDTFSDDPLVLASTALVGAEIGAWLSMVLGTGSMPAAQGILLTSGATWGLVYAALLVATLATSGTEFKGVGDFLPALMIAPGVGLGAMALASLRYTPSVEQLVRANLFGAGVGSGVLLITALAAGGFGKPLPYVLGLVSSAAAMSLVTLLWAEPAPELGRRTYTGRREPKRAYDNPWW